MFAPAHPALEVVDSVGWSPDGWKSEMTRNGATVRCKSVVGLTLTTVRAGTDI